MSEDAAEYEAPAQPQAQPQQQVFIVPPALMSDVLNKLQDELPMKSVRNVVLQLEQCPLMNLNVQNDAGPDSNSD